MIEDRPRTVPNPPPAPDALDKLLGWAVLAVLVVAFAAVCYFIAPL